jgi:hypothetical protein
MTAPRLCSKCRARVRVRDQRWCRECRNDSKRRARGTARGTEGTTREGTQFGGAPGTTLTPASPPSAQENGPLAPPQHLGRRWLDYDDAAQIAGCSPHTIADACQRGVLPFRVVMWRRRNFRRKKRMIADVDLLNWIYLRPHWLPQRRAWREPDAGLLESPPL